MGDNMAIPKTLRDILAQKNKQPTCRDCARPARSNSTRCDDCHKSSRAAIKRASRERTRERVYVATQRVAHGEGLLRYVDAPRRVEIDIAPFEAPENILARLLPLARDRALYESRIEHFARRRVEFDVETFRGLNGIATDAQIERALDRDHRVTRVLNQSGHRRARWRITETPVDLPTGVAR